MQAVVLAHERAEGLDPFTETRPRALVPVLAEPVLVHTLRALHAAGVTEALVLTGHLGERLPEEMGRDAAGVALRWRAVEPAEGAAPALAQALREARGPVFVADSGLFAEAGLLAPLADALRESPADAPPLVALATNVNPLYHPRVRTGPDGRVQELCPVGPDETRGSQQSPLDSMPAGCLAVPPGGAQALADLAADAEPQTFAALLEACVRRGPGLRGVRADRRFAVLDYPWEILAANYFGLDLLFDTHAPVRRIPASARVHPQAILKNTVDLGEDVVVEAGAVLDNVRLGARTQVLEHSYVQHAAAAQDCRIGPLALVRGSVLGPKTKVGCPTEFPVAVAFGNSGFAHHGHFGMGVYGEAAALAAGVIVAANRGEPVKCRVRGELLASGWFNLGAFVGDRARLNAQATVMPGRKLGAGCVIGPGVIVYRDVPPGTTLILRQNLEERPPAPQG